MPYPNSRNSIETVPPRPRQLPVCLEPVFPAPVTVHYLKAVRRDSEQPSRHLRYWKRWAVLEDWVCPQGLLDRRSHRVLGGSTRVPGCGWPCRRHESPASVRSSGPAPSSLLQEAKTVL